MHRMPIAVLAAGVALSGCNNSQPQQGQTNQRPIKVRGSEQERLHQLNAFDLAIALKRAIYDAGYACRRVTDAGFIGNWKNLDGWMAACADGANQRNWAIFTAPDGSAQVRDCKDIPGTGLPECIIKQRPEGSFTELESNAAQNAQ